MGKKKSFIGPRNKPQVQNPPRRRQASRAVTVRKQGGVMDKAAVDYMRLLFNPCSAPLVHPVGHGDGGFLTRVESDFLIGQGVGETAGYMFWTPGALNAAAGANLGTLVSTGLITTDTTASVTTSGGVGSYFPGYAYLQSNASAYRCVAACMQFYFPGTELNRSGLVSGATCTRAQLGIGATTTVATLRTASPHVDRTPTDHIEIKFRPTPTDMLYRDPNTTNVPEDGHGAILGTWSGFPAAGGIRIRLVGVYEWLPKQANGLVISQASQMHSSISPAEIREKLDSSDESWWYDAGQKAANFGLGIAAVVGTQVVARNVRRYQQIGAPAAR